MAKNPYSGTTYHPKKEWCGATSEVTLANGNRINVICTRFKDHMGKGKNPLQHFDEVRRRSWYEQAE